MNRFVEVVKQFQSLIAALLPFLTTKVPLFPFLNPQIAHDLWPITSILSLIASITNFNLTNTAKYRNLALKLGIIGFVIGTLSYVIIIAVVSRIVFDGAPGAQDFSVQIAFIFLFIGVGLATGWCFGKILT